MAQYPCPKFSLSGAEDMKCKGMKMQYISQLKMKSNYRFYNFCCIALFVLILTCESNTQKESKVIISTNPWLKPLILNAPKISSNTSNSKTKGHRARINLYYQMDPHIGQKLFLKIDSAAKANGWLETDIRAGDKFIDFKTYWKNWHGEYGINGQYNLIIWFCNLNSIILDWQAAPSDSEILNDIKCAHDPLRDDLAYKGYRKSYYVSKIGRYLSMLPQDHQLYRTLDSELEGFLLADPIADIRVGVTCIYSDWKLKSKFHRADSLLERACDDTSPIVRLYGAMGLMRLGDSGNSKAPPILVEFATGKVINKISESVLLGERILAYRNSKTKEDEVQNMKRTLRMEAVGALKISSTESAKKALEQLKTDSSQEIRNIIQNRH